MTQHSASEGRIESLELPSQHADYEVRWLYRVDEHRPVSNQRHDDAGIDDANTPCSKGTACLSSRLMAVCHWQNLHLSFYYYYD